ncbi:hypothetical protein BK025_01130 [Sodalis sp. TME1]|nr:hypothetical protein BK025_01130 [Sodalis sp. TME1]
MLDDILESMKVLGKLRVFVIFLNLVLIILCAYNLVDMGFFAKYGSRFPYDPNRAAMMWYLIIISSLSIFCISKPLQKKITREPSIFSLWLKRKRLEHLAKIEELEK